MSNSGPSSIPSPPPNAATSPPSPHVAPPPIPSHVVDPPTSSNNQAKSPLAHLSTSQHAQDDEAGPLERPSTIPPAVPPQGHSSAPSCATVEPSTPPGSAAGPSGPPPLSYQNYCTTLPSEEQLWSQTDVPTSSLKIKGRLATLWEESLHHMDSLTPPAQMDQFAELYVKVAELELQLNDPAQASHALRAEIKDLTKKKNSLEVSLAITDHKLRDLQEKQSHTDSVHQQSMNQQALEHQRAMDQLTQKLHAVEALVQDQDQKLKSQEALLKSQETQLTSQATELSTARSELAQARATTEGVSTALAIYREGRTIAAYKIVLCICVLQSFVHRWDIVFPHLLSTGRAGLCDNFTSKTI
ncbi:transcription elongation regulator 1-like [Zingiber officinale]|uniref:transcription elongation regulator 1-like n=1 Tax=Zingiber officinale TaxID=94328 RepID=UPI001C4C3119|nr:transcription elongation regulator 1-like [Zingiber officinale]